jgi:hypothetical protein
MALQDILDTYAAEKTSLQNQNSSMDTLIQPIQLKIDEFTYPSEQLDLVIANLTVQVNQKIYDLSQVANASASCGCGKSDLVPLLDINGNPTGFTTAVAVGTTVYYEQLASYQINANDPNYTGIDPYSYTSGLDPLIFTDGIGYGTTINGLNSDAILNLIVTNGGSGYISSTYYSKTLSGGSGSGAVADIIVGSGKTVTSAIIYSGGSGYKVGDTLSIVGLGTTGSGAVLKVDSIGSPVLGYGNSTYVNYLSGVFIQEVDSGQSSSCPTSCSSYSTQYDTINNALANLRSQRNTLIGVVNSLKSETQRYYIQRYGFVYAKSENNSRLNDINSSLNILNNPSYNQYFK